MQKWLRHNLTIAVIITLITGYGVGAAIAAVLKSDVERLKSQIDGMPERLGRLEQKVDDSSGDIEDIKKSVHRIEDYIIK